METEQRINKISELLQKYEDQNQILKDKGKFNMQQSNNTMKRLAQEMGSYFLKELKTGNVQKTKPKVIILDDNILSLSCYAEEYPENFKAITDNLNKEKRP